MALKRNKPLKRDGEGARKFANQRSKLSSRSELKRSELRRSADPMKRSGQLAQRSEKRQKHMSDERIPYIQALVAAGVGCEIGHILAEIGVPNPDCASKIEGLHERRKRSAGGSLVNHANLVGSCNSCNSFVEDYPTMIRELTGDVLVVREGDPEWERLGARSDRMDIDFDIE